MKYILIVLFFIITSCDGTLRGFKNRSFLTPKNTIEKAIDNLYAKNPKLKIPEKWKTYDTWKKRGFEFLDTRILYFQSDPEEMYYISFVKNGKENQDENGPTILSIRSVFTKEHNKWLKEEDFENNEKERIEKRFDTEIINELEKYSGIKAKKEH